MFSEFNSTGLIAGLFVAVFLVVVVAGLIVNRLSIIKKLYIKVRGKVRFLIAKKTPICQYASSEEFPRYNIKP